MPTKAHVGIAGQLALMAEFAIRGYNVSIPEVDEGDDAWVVNHKTGHAWRFQVKTARPKAQGESYRYQFAVKQEQITRDFQPPVVFAFVMRAKTRFQYVIIDRKVLKNYIDSKQIGTQEGESHVFTLVYYFDGEKKGKVYATKKLEVTHHLNNWSDWPEI